MEKLSENYVVGMPLFLQRAIFGALAAIARRRGYDPEARYAAPEMEPVRPRPSVLETFVEWETVRLPFRDQTLRRSGS